MQRTAPTLCHLAVIFALTVSTCGATRASAADPLLEEAVDFTGTIVFLETKVPGLVIAAIRNGEVVVKGYGETAKDSGKEPDGDTIFRIGSITKAFTGAALASMVADGEVQFTDKLQDRLGWKVKIPDRDGKPIRLIDLATHASGLPRESQDSSVGADGDRTTTKEDYIKSLEGYPLLFTPGAGILYSNFGFDLLAQALANVEGKPYADLLKARVLDPAGLKDTKFDLAPGDEARAMQGHNFDGSPMPFSKTALMIVGAGGLYSTPNDIMRWLKWHLDRNGAKDAEMRLLDHATYLQRDGLSPVFGLDEGVEMDAMGLAWVMLAPEGNRPLILNKSGGLQGIFSYVAIAPSRNIGVFMAINEFNASGFEAMAKAANELITELAPR
ncbi:MAG TPA: D-alanyl-D-alanine-carboxypeptidase/endopeptidase AmpH [Methyloceanibacter sp.]